MSLTKAPVRKFTSCGLQPGDQRFYECFVLVEGRAHHARHGRQVGEQIDEAVHVAPELDHAVLWQRPHDRRPKQPEFGLEELRGEELLDALPVQHRFRGQRDAREGEAVGEAQAEMRAMDDAEVAIEDMRLDR